MDGTASNAFVSMSGEAWQALYKDAHARRQIEACGALLGHIDEMGNWHVTQIQPLRNIANSSVYFEFDPQELLELELTRSGEMVGVYHSHPSGYPHASQTDRQNMQRVNAEQRIPWVWLIVVGPFDQGATATPRAYHYYEDRGLLFVPIRIAG